MSFSAGGGQASDPSLQPQAPLAAYTLLPTAPARPFGEDDKLAHGSTNSSKTNSPTVAKREGVAAAAAAAPSPSPSPTASTPLLGTGPATPSQHRMSVSQRVRELQASATPVIRPLSLGSPLQRPYRREGGSTDDGGGNGGEGTSTPSLRGAQSPSIFLPTASPRSGRQGVADVSSPLSSPSHHARRVSAPLSSPLASPLSGSSAAAAAGVNASGQGAAMGLSHGLRRLTAPPAFMFLPAAPLMTHAQTAASAAQVLQHAALQQQQQQQQQPQQQHELQQLQQQALQYITPARQLPVVAPFNLPSSHGMGGRSVTAAAAVSPQLGTPASVASRLQAHAGITGSPAALHAAAAAASLKPQHVPICCAAHGALQFLAVLPPPPAYTGCEKLLLAPEKVNVVPPLPSWSLPVANTASPAPSVAMHEQRHHSMHVRGSSGGNARTPAFAFARHSVGAMPVAAEGDTGGSADSPSIHAWLAEAEASSSSSAVAASRASIMARSANPSPSPRSSPRMSAMAINSRPFPVTAIPLATPQQHHRRASSGSNSSRALSVHVNTPTPPSLPRSLEVPAGTSTTISTPSPSPGATLTPATPPPPLPVHITQQAQPSQQTLAPPTHRQQASFHTQTPPGGPLRPAHTVPGSPHTSPPGQGPSGVSPVQRSPPSATGSSGPVGSPQASPQMSPFGLNAATPSWLSLDTSTPRAAGAAAAAGGVSSAGISTPTMLHASVPLAAHGRAVSSGSSGSHTPPIPAYSLGRRTQQQHSADSASPETIVPSTQVAYVPLPVSSSSASPPATSPAAVAGLSSSAAAGASASPSPSPPAVPAFTPRARAASAASGLPPNPPPPMPQGSPQGSPPTPKHPSPSFWSYQQQQQSPLHQSTPRGDRPSPSPAPLLRPPPSPVVSAAHSGGLPGLSAPLVAATSVPPPLPPFVPRPGSSGGRTPGGAGGVQHAASAPCTPLSPTRRLQAQAQAQASPLRGSMGSSPSPSAAAAAALTQPLLGDQQSSMVSTSGLATLLESSASPALSAASPSPSPSLSPSPSPSPPAPTTPLPLSAQLASLRAQLARAVAEQRFEECIPLRDLIAQMEATSVQSTP